jgi:wyosine [tRNA(Phe)-imidazoG37] synthetase (radical SAM superfamily)
MSAKFAPSGGDENRPPQDRASFAAPCDFLGNRFVYIVVSPRARGLSIGLDMNPDKFCNFDCVYCEVNRAIPPQEKELDISVMVAELERTLNLIHSVGIRQLPEYHALGKDLARLRHVAFSGQGEPTLCLHFADAVGEVARVRARGFHPFFKMVLITNGSRLDLRPVQEGLLYFTREDEIWIKLDAGTQAYMDRVNRSEISLERVLANATVLGRKRPIIIQTLFPQIDGQGPPPGEIDQYLQRLRQLKDAGARIPLVQLYSATRPTAQGATSQVPLPDLIQISQRIRTEIGLDSAVF